MAEFFNVLPPDEARELLLSFVRPIDGSDRLETAAALGRVTAGEIAAPHALPSFRRSAMDGYAVRAADTHGAGDSLPAFLAVIGEVRMGLPADQALGVGEAVIVHTGGMLPATADAVVPVEHTQPVGSGAGDGFPYEIECYRAAAVGQHVIQIGEDVGEGEFVVAAGALLRPQEIGGLLALGITEIAVTRQPRVAILSTGDEVVSPAAVPLPGQIRDINSYTIAAQCVRAGALPLVAGIVRDDLDALREAAAAALADADMLVISAGSSVSARDMTGEVIDGLGRPGVLLHGVATRPGKPTIAGAVDGMPVLGLPGNPVSAMIQFHMLGVPAIYRLQGAAAPPPQRTVRARLTHNVASESGREDYIPARLEPTKEGMAAEPIFGKSNLIYTLIRADGLLKIPLNAGGLLAGDWVEVLLF